MSTLIPRDVLPSTCQRLGCEVYSGHHRLDLKAYLEHHSGDKVDRYELPSSPLADPDYDLWARIKQEWLTPLHAEDTEVRLATIERLASELFAEVQRFRVDSSR